MALKTGHRRKTFAILSIFLILFGCIFLNAFAIGEENLETEESDQIFVLEGENEADSQDFELVDENPEEMVVEEDDQVLDEEPVSEIQSEDIEADVEDEVLPDNSVSTLSVESVASDSEDAQGDPDILVDGVLHLSEDAVLKGSEGSWTVTIGENTSEISGLDYVSVDGSAMITLENFALASKNGPAIAVEAGSVTLVLEGSNSLTGASGCAGVFVDTDAALTINGTGSLYAKGGDYRSSMLATGPSYLKKYVGQDSATFKYCSAAGIGSNGMVLYKNAANKIVASFVPSFGSVAISGGTVVAVGGDATNQGMGSGAGIGSGGQSSTKIDDVKLEGSIIIAGGSVTAQGGTGATPAHGGAGIGAGGCNDRTYWGNYIEIEISGGSVSATGGKCAAGIGGGDNMDGAKLTISGGEIVAQSGESSYSLGAAGIGGGDESGTADIIITGGSVKAYGNGCGAGIGAGNCGGLIWWANSSSYQYSSISISNDAVVYAYGGSGRAGRNNGGAGIGMGDGDDPYIRYNLGFDTISISNSATVRAYAGPGAQAIGAGSNYTYSENKVGSPSNSVQFTGQNINVWMFNSDTIQGAFYGQTEDGSSLNKTTSFNDCNGVWYTTAASDLPDDGDMAYVSDPNYEAEYYWTKGDGTVDVDFLGVAATSEETQGYSGNWATVNVDMPEADITVTPVSITSYVGGTSASGNHMPVLRFNVDAGELDADSLTYEMFTQYREPTSADCDHYETLEEEPVVVEKASATGSYYVFDKLDAGMGGIVDVGPDGDLDTTNDPTCQKSSYLKLVDMTATDDANVNTSELHAGVYQIMLRSNTATHWKSWHMVATDANGTKHLVEVVAPTAAENVTETDPTVTVRFVSKEDEMYAYTDETQDETKNQNVSMTLVVTSEDDVDTTGGAAVAVVDEDTTFITNGDPELGIFGANDSDDQYIDDSSAVVALLYDEILSGKDIAGVIDSGDLENIIDKDIEDIDLSEYQTQNKYLDLVNVTDGNAQVTADNDVTVYWPYPDGITYEDAQNYEFRLVHYKGLEREYMSDNTIDDAVPEEIEVEATEYGLKFTTSSFSPFTLLWKDVSTNDADPSGTSGTTTGIVATDTNPAEMQQVSTNDGAPKTFDATVSAALLGVLGLTGVGLTTLGAAVGRRRKK